MKNILPISFMLFLLFGCTEKQVSSETPYTVQIKQIRSYYKALDIEQRLEGMGVSTYIISEATEDGDWYRIVTGAEKSLADIQELKEKIQNKIGIDDLEVI
jgi:cell division septation protein DedD